MRAGKSSALMTSVLLALPGLVAAAPAGADDSLARLMALQTGSFSSALQSRYDARYDEVIWHIAEIWPDSDDGARWTYTEAWLAEAESPYMQRIARYALDADGSIVSARYTIPDAPRWVGAWQQPGRLPALDRSQLSALPGCETVMTRTGEQRFEGGTTGRRCANAHRGAAYAVSRTVLTPELMSNWDRGFAADGTLRWGPSAGGYEFRRLDGGQRCDEPVRLLVYGNVTDRGRFVAYARALAASGLYQQHGGYYEATTPPLEVLEGSPPPGRGVIIARFPCREAVQRFWQSPGYTEIRKLREGVAEFEVLILPTARRPAD